MGTILVPLFAHYRPTAPPVQAAFAEGLGVQDEVRMRCPASSPADDPPCISVDDEGDIDEAGPGRDVGKIRVLQTVWSGSVELSVPVIQRTESRLVADRCPQRLARTAPEGPYPASTGRPCSERR